MTYYAVDSYDPKNLRDALLAQVSSASTSDHWFAMLDSAFDHKGKRLRWLNENLFEVYHQGRLARLAEVSPLLIPLQHKSEHLGQELMRLLTHCRGRPMLSFIRSKLSAEAIREQWQSTLEIATEDAQSFVLRFADTRVLPALIEIGEVWQRVAGEIAEWQIIGRNGDLVTLELPNASDTGNAPVRIDDKGLAQLLESGAADALATMLDEHFPELLPAGQGARVHARLLQLASVGEKHGIAGSTEIFALAVADFSTQNRLLEHSAFSSWLSQRPWQSAQLEDALGDFLENHFMEYADT